MSVCECVREGQGRGGEREIGWEREAEHHTLALVPAHLAPSSVARGGRNRRRREAHWGEVEMGLVARLDRAQTCVPVADVRVRYCVVGRWLKADGRRQRRAAAERESIAAISG